MSDPIGILPIFGNPTTPAPIVKNSGGGPPRMANNLVTFTPNGGQAIYLKLESSWKMRCGIEPDINVALMPYTEFAKFGGKPDVYGNIDLWYNNTPGKGPSDVTIVGVKVIAVEPVEQRDTPNAGILIVEYLVYFADFREQYVAPRGGRIRDGGYNLGKKPVYVPGQPAVDSASPERSLSQLIAICLTKMGLANADLPGNIDQTEPPRDIKWFGNHAPTELQKLLDLCSCVFVPGLNGVGSIQQITDSGTPLLPPGDAMPEQQTPKIDRRGKYVIFSSYPTRSINTLTQSGPSAATWYFVVEYPLDSNTWIPIDTLSTALIQAGVSVPNMNFAGLAKNGFRDLPDTMRDKIVAQAYRCIRRCQTTIPESVSPTLNLRFENDSQVHSIQVMSRISQPDGNGRWKLASAPVEISVQRKTDQGVLWLARALVATTTQVANVLFGAEFAASTPFTVRFSQEATPPDGYFHVGFSGGANGTAVQLGSDDVENAIDGNLKDTIILTRPQLRLLNIDGQDVNRNTLNAIAQQEAAQWLKDASKPARILSARGFANVGPSGLVTQVEWDQENLKTVVKVSDWFLPDGALILNGQLRKNEAAGLNETYPNQQKMEASRTANGESGATQPVVAMQVPPAAISPPAFRLVQVKGFYPGGGFSSGVYGYGSAQQMGADAIAGNGLMMPEGMNVNNKDNSVILANLPESGQGTHIVPINSWQIAFPLGTYTKAGVGLQTQTNDVLALIAMGEVDIQITGAAGSLGGGIGGGNYTVIIPNGSVSGEDPRGTNFAMPAKGQSIPTSPVIAYGQNLFESKLPAGFHGLDVDGSVWVRGGWSGFCVADGNGLVHPIYHFRAEIPLDVTVVKDGGSDGTPNLTYPTATPAPNTWTYTVTGRDGTQLGTGMLPKWQRELGTATPGIKGLIRIRNGVVELLDVDDFINAGTC